MSDSCPSILESCDDIDLAFLKGMLAGLSTEALEERLHLTSGSVSPLGLLFDNAHEITLCYETGVRDTDLIAFHACDNAATVIFTQKVFWEQVVPALGLSPRAIELPVLENDG